MENNYFTLVTGDGKEIKALILFTFNSPEFNKNYVLFQPEGFEGVSAASFTEGEEGGSLAPIETDAEWELVQNMYNEFIQANSSCAGGCGHCGGECDCDGECDGECCGKDECHE